MHNQSALLLNPNLSVDQLGPILEIIETKHLYYLTCIVKTSQDSLVF